MSIQWSIETHDSVLSTQDIAKGMGDIGEPEGFAVQALEQTGGRGRYEREWVSEKGNLYLSFLLRPDCPATLLGQLSLMTSVALVRTIKPYLRDASALQLKWPNDVMLGGKKCAGLLLETDLTSGGSVRYCVIGVGVNLTSAPEDIASSLSAFTDQSLDLERFRDQFLENFAKLYQDWLVNGFDSLRSEWLSFSHPKGTPLKIKVGAQLEQGLFYDIDEYGNARLQDKALRLITVSAGDVYLYEN